MKKSSQVVQTNSVHIIKKIKKKQINEENKYMENNSKLLVEICKDVISEMVKNGFYENNLSKKQLKKLKEIKERNKR